MATSTTSSTSSAKEKTVATYLPGKGIKNIRRVISAKDAKQMEVTLENDLVWEAANGHRVDVSNVPEPLVEVLKRDKDFKISNETS